MGGGDEDSFVIAVEQVGAEVHVVGDCDQAWVWAEGVTGAGGALATAGCDLSAGLWRPGIGGAAWAAGGQRWSKCSAQAQMPIRA